MLEHYLLDKWDHRLSSLIYTILFSIITQVMLQFVCCVEISA